VKSLYSWQFLRLLYSWFLDEDIPLITDEFGLI